MPSVVNNRGGSQINFFMSRAPEVVWSEPVQHTTAPKSAKNGPQILTFALQRRPRATRASTNKVKTGCITCK
ncbi:hypothetical protein CGMCC3_g10817 [Colletotrichum fructicola]|nr:uncharacterized protein CGMCC3_g10817 [Colletotrichum fructicola]KAE9573056.1 hypothetical protein CGMCC3_g10817 [Colletotrichum fructicola]